MAERVELFTLPVPATTLPAAPLTTPLTFDEGVVERLEIIVPAGHVGLTGLQIVHSTQIIIPYSGTQWITADDEKISWELQGYPIGSKWSVRQYNQDIFSHTFYIRLLVNEVPEPASRPAQLLVIE